MAHHAAPRPRPATSRRRPWRRLIPAPVRTAARRIAYHAPFAVYALGTLGAITWALVMMFKAAG